MSATQYAWIGVSAALMLLLGTVCIVTEPFNVGFAVVEVLTYLWAFNCIVIFVADFRSYVRRKRERRQVEEVIRRYGGND